LTRTFAAVSAAFLMLSGLAACSSDKTVSGSGVPSAATSSAAGSSAAASSSTASTSTSGTPTSGTPTSGTPSAATVRDGLLKISELSGKIVATATTSSAEAKTQAEGIEPLWAPIEDVVKNNDSSTYLALEDAFALLESGDMTKIAQGAGKVSSTVTAYIAKYPG